MQPGNPRDPNPNRGIPFGKDKDTKPMLGKKQEVSLAAAVFAEKIRNEIEKSNGPIDLAAQEKQMRAVGETAMTGICATAALLTAPAVLKLAQTGSSLSEITAGLGLDGYLTLGAFATAVAVGLFSMRKAWDSLATKSEQATPPRSNRSGPFSNN